MKFFYSSMLQKRKRLISNPISWITIGFCFLLIAGCQSRLQVEKDHYSNRKWLTLEEAVKLDPKSVTAISISNYTDSIFPNEALVRFKNLERLQVLGPWHPWVKKRSKDLKLDFRSELADLFPHLKRLSLLGFKQEEFPVELLQLKQLESLSLFAFGIQHLPENLDELQQLKLLELRMNCLESLPASLANMPNLEVLDLSNNALTRIPEVLFRCTAIQKLWIGNSEGHFQIHHPKMGTNVIDHLQPENDLIRLKAEAQLDALVFEMLDCEKLSALQHMVKDRDANISGWSASCWHCKNCDLVKAWFGMKGNRK